MVDVPQYRRGGAGVIRRSQRFEETLAAERSVLKLSRLEKAHYALGMVPELTKPFPVEPVGTIREKIEYLPVGHARGDEGLRVVAFRNRRVQQDERMDTFAFRGVQLHMGNHRLSLTPRSDQAADEGAGDRVGPPSLSRERSDQSFCREGLQGNPDSGASELISGFDLNLRERRSRSQFAGQDRMPKHLESHRTFGGRARGVR